MERAEYFLLLDGLSRAEIGRIGRCVLSLLLDERSSGETDIPWDLRSAWPQDVVAAAVRLRERFVKRPESGGGYGVTKVRPLADTQDREDFMAVAPYAYDATFWDGDWTAIASLSDEGTSFVVMLTHDQHEAVERLAGKERVRGVSA